MQREAVARGGDEEAPIDLYRAWIGPVAGEDGVGVGAGSRAASDTCSSQQQQHKQWQ
eukprot:COSAG04_NODE_31776_length_255_cov_0.583333_1_plen_56_part_10